MKKNTTVRIVSKLFVYNCGLGLEIGLTPRRDTITFVISDGDTEKSAACCDGGKSGRTRGTVQHSLPVYDLHITVFPVDSQPPSLTTGGPFLKQSDGVQRGSSEPEHLLQM